MQEKPTYEELERRVGELTREADRRLLAEAALKRSNEILKGILSASPIGIGLAENRRFEWVNQAMVRMFGFKSESDYRGKSSRMIYPSDDEFLRVGRIIYRRFKEGRSAELDCTLERVDGTTFTGHLKISSPDPESPMRNTIFTLSDETFRVKAEKEARQREKLQGALELAAAVCHELNQPLMSISGYSELALIRCSPDEPLHGKLSSIKDQVDRMGAITKKLMQITHYKAKSYGGGQVILDIDRASEEE